MTGDAGRGTGWVVAQFVVMALVVAACLALPGWPGDVRTPLAVVGAILGVTGAAVAVRSARVLGRSLTPFPRPAADGDLVETGPFARVRHPIYAGGLLFFGGLSIAFGPWPLVVTAVLAVLWALKARVEERHLAARYPGYAAYVARVRHRLVPGVY
jgi:protein-S-isoprenylcysteine O-methyltransferase Ste14